MPDEHSAETLQSLILDSLKRIEQDVREIRAEQKDNLKESNAEINKVKGSLAKLQLEFAIFRAKAITYGGIAGLIAGTGVSILIKNVLGT